MLSFHSEGISSGILHLLSLSVTKGNTHIHYENLPIQYTENFFGCENEKMSLEKMIYEYNFAQNIDCDCGYTLEPPWRDGSNEYPHSMFWIKNTRSTCGYTPVNHSFTIKSGVKGYIYFTDMFS